MAAERNPGDLRYHPEHDWARIEDGEATFGITWFAQDALGELVHFEAPEEGLTVSKDQSYAEVEAVKAVSDVTAPVSGGMLEVNREVAAAPEMVDEGPSGEGPSTHCIPAIVDAVLQRGELLTAYTPYQPELSQAVLQAIFEYQTAICELTGMDVSNASGYDGTTVAADACYIAKHATGRTKVVITEATNPQVRQVVKTYAPGFGLQVVEVPHRDGVTDPEELRTAAEDAACAIFQQPNFFGNLEPAPELAAAASEVGAYVFTTWRTCGLVDS